MTFFSRFRKKPEPEVIPTDSVKAIVDGVLFEDAFFIKWGSEIESDKGILKKNIVRTG